MQQKYCLIQKQISLTDKPDDCYKNFQKLFLETDKDPLRASKLTLKN